MKLTIAEVLQRAVEAHRGGKLQDAERLYKAILRAQPNHPDANHNLGVLAVSVGKTLDALMMFQTALDANPEIEQFWFSYIDALLKLERLDEAARLIANAKKAGIADVKLNDFHEQLLQARCEDQEVSSGTPSRSGEREGPPNKGERKKKKARVQKSTAQPKKSQIKALMSHFHSGHIIEAEQLALSLTEKFPDHQLGWTVLAAVFRQTRRAGEALAATRKCAELSPRDGIVHSNLGLCYKDLGRLDEAEAALRKSVAFNPQVPEVHNNLGSVLLEFEERAKLEQALVSFERASQLKPNYAEALVNAGITLQGLGDLEKASAKYNQAIYMQIDYAPAYRCLMGLNRDDLRAHLPNMQRLYQDNSLSDDYRCQICFALAKALEHDGDFAGAYGYYREGNVLRNEQLGYDAGEIEQLFSRLKMAAHGITLQALSSESSPDGPVPIFLVGMPRSGTTLVEQIVSSHSEVTGAGELSLVKYFGHQLATGFASLSCEAIQTFRGQYLDALKQRSAGKAYVTDKMPTNFMYLGLISAAFPEAKIIHVTRDAAAVCWANYTQYFVSEELSFCYGLDNILRYHSLYEDLMEHWHQILPGRIYNLSYEKLTAHQAEETLSLTQHLGLSWETACLSPEKNIRSVVTASSSQVREKVYQGSSKRWKRYKPFLSGKLNHFNRPV